MSIVSLDTDQTRICCDTLERSKAINAAYYVTLSPHEHEWTLEQQQAMAQYVLWASQRLSAIMQCVEGELDHQGERGSRNAIQDQKAQEPAAARVLLNGKYFELNGK